MMLSETFQVYDVQKLENLNRIHELVLLFVAVLVKNDLPYDVRVDQTLWMEFCEPAVLLTALVKWKGMRVSETSTDIKWED